MSLLRERSINAEPERNNANAQVRNMQPQMHPHFLFNALNTINQTAILEGSTETPKLMRALSGIMRRTLDQNDKPETLGEELDQIKNYPYIAQTSIGDRLKLECKVDESCLDAVLPAFTIQPLVENAIIHGPGRKPEGGTLSISGQKLHGLLHISICDTGCGMDEQTLQAIQSLKANGYAANGSASIGIRNSMQILSAFFGPSFNWFVDSTPEKGTLFHLRVPYRPMLPDRN